LALRETVGPFLCCVLEGHNGNRGGRRHSAELGDEGSGGGGASADPGRLVRRAGGIGDREAAPLLDLVDLDADEADTVCAILVPKLSRRSGLDGDTFAAAVRAVIASRDWAAVSSSRRTKLMALERDVWDAGG
jgi:hypothetical protein